MAKIIETLDLRNVDLVRNLIELLQTKFSELPKEIQESLMLIEEGGLNDIATDYFLNTYGYGFDYKNNFHSQEVTAVNKILKKVCYIDHDEDDNLIHKVEYPEHFWCSVNGKKVIEW